jgi:predicted amidohydrolase YtcJ
MDILLKNVTLIDGTGRAPQLHAVIAVRDGDILYAGPSSGWSETRKGVIPLDLGGQFALPGLIDTHVHLAGSGEADSQFEANDGSMVLKMLSNA